MVRAFSTLGCPEADLRTALALAERYNVEAIELRSLGDTVNLPNYLASEYGTPESFAQHMREQKVRVVSLDTSLHLADAKTSERDQFLAFVPWAEAAEIKWLRVFDGAPKGHDRPAIHAALDTVRWWRDVRNDNGYKVDIMVETHNQLLTAHAIADFVAAAPKTAILWDAHHTWKQGQEDPVATWRAIAPHVVHVHVKDSVPIPTAKHPYKYVLPGEGDFPMAKLRAALEADRFTGPVSLEWEKLWHPELPSLDEALQAAVEKKWW
jgi:sugar phosphate isomerase/epimerase